MLTIITDLFPPGRDFSAPSLHFYQDSLHEGRVTSQSSTVKPNRIHCIRTCTTGSATSTTRKILYCPTFFFDALNIQRLTEMLDSCLVNGHPHPVSDTNTSLTCQQPFFSLLISCSLEKPPRPSEKMVL